jgi:hypothetical protein
MIMMNGLSGALCREQMIRPRAINRQGWATSVTASSSWL